MVRNIFLVTNLILILIFPVILKQKPPTNNILYEHGDINILDRRQISFAKMEFRPIAPNMYKHNMTIVLTRPVTDLWVNYVLYHKYAVYQKFLIDIWEDICGFWNGTASSPVSNIVLDNSKFLGFKYNFPFKCPIVGTMAVIHDGFNASNIVFPLLPAGRYRLECRYAHSKKGQAFLEFKHFFQVSDLRVWF